MTKRKVKAFSKYWKASFIVVLFVAVGVFMLILSSASTPTANIEPENGIVSQPAISSPNITASKNTAIKFTAISSALGMSVSENKFKKDGLDFYPKGFNAIAIEMPEDCPRPKADAKTARDNFTQTAMDSYKNTWKANTIRFQLSQVGLDPQGELATTQSKYLQLIDRGVKLARSNGLVVILSIQDQVFACGFAHKMPSSETKRAWEVLAPIYKNDPYIMFELFNEPDSQYTDADWNQWRNGGTGPVINTGSNGSTYDVVGHQTLVNTIRAKGSKNVIIASAAGKGAKLTGIWQSTKNYLLTDTLTKPQLAFSIHPYYFHMLSTSTLDYDTSQWNARYGFMLDSTKVPLSVQIPIIATEWNASLACYTPNQEVRTPQFLSYLRNKNIGILGHVWDVKGTLVTNVPGWNPSTFTTGGTECSKGSDAGQILQDFYKSIP